MAELERPSAPPRREALIVAADRYEDPRLSALNAPAQDAEGLAHVLGDPNVGNFEVGVSLNEPDHIVRRKLSTFFSDRSRDDLLLLHVSCHGLKDEDGSLYFASSNTIIGHLEATAIPSEFVHRQMTKSRSRRIIFLIDCCFGGAFARGLVHRADTSIPIKEEFQGHGRVVLTASSATQYAFEGHKREGNAQPSIFTSAIIEGLATGEADRDLDSRVSVDELYDYVYDRVREVSPNQTPEKWAFKVAGGLYIARTPFRKAVRIKSSAKVVHRRADTNPKLIGHPLQAHYTRVVRKLFNGLVTPFLGPGINVVHRPADFRWHPLQDQYPPTQLELAKYLSSTFIDLSADYLELAQVAQSVSMTEGTGALYQALHAAFTADYIPGPVHTFLSQLQPTLREHGTAHQVILTTNYDDTLERTFDAIGQEYDLLTYVSVNPPEHRGRFLHRSPKTGASTVVELPSEYQGIDVSQRPVIIKINGGIDRSDSFDNDNYVITEDDFINYMSRSDISYLLPWPISQILRNSHFLFLGTSSNNWTARVLWDRIWGSQSLEFPSWSIQTAPDELETRFWESRDVTVIDIDLKHYIETLRASVFTAAEAS